MVLAKNKQVDKDYKIEYDGIVLIYIQCQKHAAI